MFNQLLKYDYNLAKHQAWSLARSVQGNGEGIFELEKDHWTIKFGERQGYMLFRKIEKEKMNSEKNIATDVSNFILFWN